jgi:O-methyltransferase
MDGGDALRYLLENGIEGDLVECGIYKADIEFTWIDVLQQSGQAREIYLYDTFTGLTPPTDFDFELSGHNQQLSTSQGTLEFWHLQQAYGGWCAYSLENVKSRLESTGYPVEKLHYVVGDVKETLQHTVPEKIALLRLDTDFYDSSLAEISALYDKVVPGGIIILDDYLFWNGQKKAIDEFFESRGLTPEIKLFDLHKGCIIKS